MPRDLSREDQRLVELNIAFSKSLSPELYGIYCALEIDSETYLLGFKDGRPTAVIPRGERCLQLISIAIGTLIYKDLKAAIEKLPTHVGRDRPLYIAEYGCASCITLLALQNICKTLGLDFIYVGMENSPDYVDIHSAIHPILSDDRIHHVNVDASNTASVIAALEDLGIPFIDLTLLEHPNIHNDATRDAWCRMMYEVIPATAAMTGQVHISTYYQDEMHELLASHYKQLTSDVVELFQQKDDAPPYLPYPLLSPKPKTHLLPLPDGIDEPSAIRLQALLRAYTIRIAREDSKFIDSCFRSHEYDYDYLPNARRSQIPSSYQLTTAIFGTACYPLAELSALKTRAQEVIYQKIAAHLHKNKMYQDALRGYLKLIILGIITEPHDNATLHFNTSRCYFHLGKYEQTKLHIETALRHCAAEKRPYYEACHQEAEALANFQAGQYATAYDQLKSALLALNAAGKSDARCQAIREAIDDCQKQLAAKVVPRIFMAEKGPVPQDKTGAPTLSKPPKMG